jgi:hypothetical protein|tara:strand:- start:2 stop:307 length:306 start_codon:yes stop_codon:yes gene_type:complete
MQNFTKQNLIKIGDSIYFIDEKNNKIFVARFKHVSSNAKSFINHLIKNWTVQNYFAELDNDVAPLRIVKKTGYISPHIKRWLKADGYPQTAEGYAAWKQAQ